MSNPVHMAITRRVRKDRAGDFERELVAFASESLKDPHSRGVHLIYPTPGAEFLEYGILRSFESPEARDQFYGSDFYKNWSSSIQHLVEGEMKARELSGLEAWFRGGPGGAPPRWKMAILTWIAVWPVSMGVPKIIVPLIGGSIPHVLRSGVVAAGIVTVLTWVAMPLLVKLAHRWIHPSAAGPKH